MGETTDEVLAIWGTLGKGGAWAGKKAYHGAQRAGMAWQNWRWGAAGSDGSSLPAATSNGAGKGGDWASIETSESTTSYYHHESSTKWTK